jgi:tyrosinase
MGTGVPARTQPPTPLRHRRDASRLTAGQLADFRAAVAGVQRIHDDRGYQHWAGIHGLPLPAWCVHERPLFLPWHRAYLYLFEKALQDVVPGATLPWWDWTAGGVPPAYARRRALRRVNPLFDSPIQPTGRRDPAEDRTWREPGRDAELPQPDKLEAMLKMGDFTTFQTELENVHGAVHMWVGGTMGSIAVAAYDPIFWAHHCMIDRCWYLWQQRHGVGVPAHLLDLALAPFPMTVRDTLRVDRLGYDYAASTTAARGPGHHG